METLSPSASVTSSNHLDGSNFDELSMEQSLLFSDCLKDLRNLKSQLYSAAEYFELSYTTDDQKQIVINTLKEYAIKALVNTVDHLGSMSFKINGLLDEKTDVVSGVDSRVSCIEQKIQMCYELVDREGLSQQSLVIKAPIFHKRYVLPVGESMSESGRYAVPKYETQKPSKYTAEAPKFQTGLININLSSSPVNTTTVEKTPSFRKMRTMSSSPSVRSRSVSPRRVSSTLFSHHSGKLFGTEKRAASSMPNPLARSGSLATRPASLNSSMSIARQHSSPPKKSVSLKLHSERNDHKDGEQHPSKGKKFLKSFLSRRKSKKDEVLYNYLNEY